MVKVIIQLLLILVSAASLAATAQEARDSIEGSWEGSLVLGRDNMNLAFTFSVSEAAYEATLTSGGMGIYGMPANTVIVEGESITIRIPRLDLEFTGTIRRDSGSGKISRIDGDWFQYSEMVPVVLLPVEEPAF